MEPKTIIKYIAICAIAVALGILIGQMKTYAAAKPEAGVEAYFTTTDVNMRKGPGLKYDLYKVLPKGYLLNTINDRDPSGWIEVWEDDDVYFVYRDYAEIRLPTNEELEKSK